MLVPLLVVVGLACLAEPEEDDLLCQLALSEYCDGDCPTFSDVEGRCYTENLCPELTVVDCNGGVGGMVFYFESAGFTVGELTAVYLWSDTPDFCTDLPAGGSLNVWYGEIPPQECRPW